MHPYPNLARALEFGGEIQIRANKDNPHGEPFLFELTMPGFSLTVEAHTTPELFEVAEHTLEKYYE